MKVNDLECWLAATLVAAGFVLRAVWLFIRFLGLMALYTAGAILGLVMATKWSAGDPRR